jgi:hypothetical protein
MDKSQDPEAAETVQTTSVPAVDLPRLVRWFVRGTKPDGTRWESAYKHDTREEAVAEMERLGPEMGDTRIMRMFYPRHELANSIIMRTPFK